VNGLPFVDARASIDANTAGIAVRDGRVVVGNTNVTFEAATNPRISALRIDAPATQLEDFNNFFDTGDTLDGTGAVRFGVVSQGHRLATNGDVDLAGFRYRNLPIGNTRALWSSAHNTISGSLAVTGGRNRTVRAKGSVHVEPSSQWQRTLLDSRYDLSIDVDKLDLATWVAALGFPEVPIAGVIDADATIRGKYPKISLKGTTTMTGGAIWRLPIDSFDAQFSSRNNRVRLDSAFLVSRGITVTASGEAGFSPNDPLALRFYLNSDDVPTLVTQLWHRSLPFEGLFESTVTIGGTFAKPTFTAAFDATDATIYGVKVPLLFGSLRLAGKSLELENAGVRFEKGDVTVAGSIPLTLSPFGLGAPNAPVSFDLAVSGLDPGIFDDVLGNGTLLAGSIDGQLGVGGTIATPRIAGDFGITDGSYASDIERTPIQKITGRLAFDRTSVRVDKFSAKLGNGTVDGSAIVQFANGFASRAMNGAGGASFDITANAHGAQVDLPQFGAGTIDAALAFDRRPHQNAFLRGDVTLTNAVIPFAAFVNAAGIASQAGSGKLPKLALAYDLNLNAGKNVRVRGSGYGAGLDIGAAGSVNLNGTFVDPKISGAYTATGGTLVYFDRAFRVQSAKVAFDPYAGIIPTLTAAGTTHVLNGDPYNPYGFVDVTLNLAGPVDNLKLSFTSNPPGYTNDQILAMIAPFGGLVSRGSYLPGTVATGINGVPMYGAVSPVPGAPGIGTASNASVSVGQEAFNILNAQFTAGLLSPLENALQSGLGFQTFALDLDYYGNVGFTATKILGRTVTFVYSSSFGTTSRQSFGLQLLGPHATSGQVSYFFESGPQRLFETPVVTGNSRLTLGLPLSGQSGFAVTLQRLYW
jgi:autotransporter translocation and assembly factor TamB